MHLSETFGFSSSDYIRKISSRSYTPQEIALNIYKKRRAINMAGVSVASGVAAAHLTGGASLLGSAYSARNIEVEKRKLKLLEEEWHRRRQYPLPKRHWKDTVIPIVIATMGGLFAYTVDLGLSNAAMQNAMVPIDSPFRYPYDIHAVSAYYTAIEHGSQYLGRKAVNTYDKRTYDEPTYKYGRKIRH